MAWFAQEVALWDQHVVSETHLLNIGQLDHYVVLEPNLVLYGTSRGAKSAQYVSSRPPSYFITHWHFQTPKSLLKPQNCLKTPQNGKNPKSVKMIRGALEKNLIIW